MTESSRGDSKRPVPIQVPIQRPVTSLSTLDTGSADGVVDTDGVTVEQAASSTTDPTISSERIVPPLAQLHPGGSATHAPCHEGTHARTPTCETRAGRERQPAYAAVPGWPGAQYRRRRPYVKSWPVSGAPLVAGPEPLVAS